MATLSFKVSDDLKRKSSQFSDVALAEIFERALQINLEKKERDEALETLNDLFRDSTFNDEDCFTLGEKLKEDLYESLKKKKE